AGGSADTLTTPMLRRSAIAVLLLALTPSLAAQQVADPAAGLAKLAPLSALRWTTDARFAPVVVALPAGGDPTRGFAARCGTWTGALVRLFARDCAAGRTPPPEWRLLIAIVPDAETFARCREA